MRISINVGLTEGQLRQRTQVLADRLDADYARRSQTGLDSTTLPCYSR